MLLKGRLSGSVRGPAATTSKQTRRVQPFKVAQTEAPEASSNGASPTTLKPSASAASSSGPKFEAMDNSFTELSDIIRLVHDTDIIEFELKSKKFNLVVRKKEALQAEQPVIQYLPAPTQQLAASAPAPAAAAPAPAPAAPAPAPTPVPAPAAVRPTGVEIGSPMAGTFYRSPAPGEPNFFKEGDKVKKGQTICIIEAMKLMNEIEAEVSGEIVKYLVENGSPVVPGQPLMIVKP